jgi:hypothetical protein
MLVGTEKSAAPPYVISGSRPSTSKPAVTSAGSTAGASDGMYSSRGFRSRSRYASASAATSLSDGVAPSSGIA